MGDATITPVSLAELGSLIGDPVRAAILLQLSDGSCRPAGELASLAGASPQAASAHLARLVDGGLLVVTTAGRRRFFKIASGEVAEIIENLANWVRPAPIRHRRDPSLCNARLCYDHLAGRLGVALFDRMSERKLLVFNADGPGLSEAGHRWFELHARRPFEGPSGRRPLVRLCLDWTERRHHLGGHLGASLAEAMMEQGYVERGARQRALLVTSTGGRFFRDELAIDAVG